MAITGARRTWASYCRRLATPVLLYGLVVGFTFAAPLIGWPTRVASALVPLLGFALVGWAGRELLLATADHLDFAREPTVATKPSTTIEPTGLNVGDAMVSAASASTRRTGMIRRGARERLRAAMHQADAEEVVVAFEELAEAVAESKRPKLVLHVGRWFSRHVQKAMLTGKAAAVAAPLERMVPHLAGVPDFKHLVDIYPIVKQCAELRAAVEDDDD